MNNRWKSAGRPELKTRIGIHTGSALVGNFGSHSRMNYTVLGDSVNLAARLESLNKVYGTEILISDTTYQQVSDQILCRPLDEVIVKGRTGATRIYEVLALTSEATNAELTLVAQSVRVLDAYSQRRFSEAAEILATILAHNPEDITAILLLSRCHTHIANPPTDDWTSAFALDEK